MTACRRYPRPADLPDPLPERLILDASAGTGKTFALEHIVLDLLLRPQADGAPLRIQQILVSTYTEKAAGEMRERIRALINLLLGGGFKEAQDGEPCWILDEPARAVLEQARMHFDRATITTIHGFCQSLLRETAFLTGEPFQTELVEGKAFFRRTLHDCIRRDWAVAGSAKAEAIRACLEAFKTEKAFGDHLNEVRMQPGLRYPEPRDPGAALARFDAAYDRSGLEALLKSHAVSGRAIGPLLKNLDLIRDAVPARDLDAARLIVGKLVAGGVGPTALFALVDTQVPGDGGRATAEALLDLSEAFDGPESSAVELFLSDACAQAEALKAREGALDFDDMAKRVARAIRQPAIQTALGELLRARYKVVLLDEFQDTSPEQWEVFQGLFGKDGRIFLIGDPKQAIYGFRGGDIHAYLEAQEGLRAQGAATVPLRKNFRSTPRMIEAYNRILDQDAAPPFFTGAIRYDQPVLPGKKELRWLDPAQPTIDLPPIRLVRVPMANPRPVGILRQELARHLAREIQALLLRGPVLQDGDAISPLRPEDIFVLTRKLEESEWMNDALREAGVPATFYKRDRVFETPEARALLDVLRAVEDPGDHACRAKAFLTPVFGATLADLRTAQDLPDAHPFLETLRAWHDLSRSGRFGELFRLMVDHGLLRRLLKQEKDDHAASIWSQLTDFMLEQCSARKGNFREAVTYLEDCIQGRGTPPGEDATMHRAATDQSAVQILTMHKAKGLQAKVVVLFGGFKASRVTAVHRFALGKLSRFWIGREPSPRLRQLTRSENREEGQRLLYVALTRAEAQLILPVFSRGPAVEGEADLPFPKGDYLLLNRRLQALLPEAGQGLFEVVELDGGPLRHVSLAANPVGLAIPEPPDPAFWARVAPAPAFESFTSLSRELHRTHRPDPEANAAPPDRHGLPGGPVIGSCLHAILEQVPLASAMEAGQLEDFLQLPAVARALQDSMAATGLKDPLKRGLAGLVHQTLLTSFQLPGGAAPMALHALRDLIREMPFLMRRPGTEDYLEGSIDLLFSWEGKTFFIDWKSNFQPDYQEATCAETVRADYSLQFAIYAIATCRFLGIDSEQAYEARFGGGLYVFLRGVPEGGQAGARPSWGELKNWEQALEAGREDEIHVRI